MIVDGVNFIEGRIKGMPLKTFVDSHIGVFWQDRDKATRRKMLEEVYNEINPPLEEEKPQE